MQNVKYLGIKCLLLFWCKTSTCPVYLSGLLKIYMPSRQLRSSTDSCVLCLPSVNAKSYSEHSFSYKVTLLQLWNTLPTEIRFSQFASTFKSTLKTHKGHIINVIYYYNKILGYNWTFYHVRPVAPLNACYTYTGYSLLQTLIPGLPLLPLPHLRT